jgi:hypothetical protein
MVGSQHPSDGLFSPMEDRTDHLPMCTGPNDTCPSGMVLHIKGYALHGLINHRDHSNVNHISSLILLNTCIKSLIHQSIAQRRYTSLQYKSGEKDNASYWASVHRKRKVPKETSSKPCKWMMWSRDVQACGCSKGQGCNVLPVGAFVECELSLLLSIKVALRWTSSEPPKFKHHLFKIQSSEVQPVIKTTLLLYIFHKKS